MALSSTAVEPASPPIATMTTLTASAQHAAMGQSLSLAVTVEPVVSGAPVPTGTVAFFDNGTPLASTTLDAAGTANLNVKIMPFGMNTITAEYSGDSREAASLSGQVVISYGSTFERVMNNASRGFIGTPATPDQMRGYDRRFGSTRDLRPMMTKLMLSPAGRQHLVQDEYAVYMERAATPEETSRVLQTARALGGSIQAAIVGSRAFYRTWSGNTTDGYLKVLESSTTGVPFSPSQQAKLANEIARGVPLTRVAYQAFSFTAAKVATTEFLYESFLGRAPTLQELARATKAPGRPVNILGLEIALISGTEFSETVASPATAGTTTTLAATTNPASPGQPLTFTATVAPSSSVSLGPIRGMVTFLSGSTVLGTVPLDTPNVGVASFVSTPPSGVVASFTTTLPVGSQSIVARYDGGVAFAGSTSSPLTVTVRTPATAQT